MFVTEQGLYANEMAPRVHNRVVGLLKARCVRSFENHIRAVAGLPLGSTEVVRPTVMVNLLVSIPKLKMCLALNGAHLHLLR